MAAELVVRRALFRILQRFIRLADFLEFLLGVGLFRYIGMVFARELAIGLLDVVVGGAAFDAEGRVVVLVFHQSTLRMAGSRIIYCLLSRANVQWVRDQRLDVAACISYDMSLDSTRRTTMHHGLARWLG